MVLLDLGLEAFLALVGGRDPRLHVGDVDLALVADRLGKRACRNTAAEDVVGGDVGEREVGIAGARLEHAVADEGVDAEHRNAGVESLLQRLDELHLVGRRDQDRVGLARDDGFEHRHLQRDVPLRGALEEEVLAERVGGRLSAAMHGDVEGVGGEARHQGDRVLLVFRARRKRERARAGNGRAGAEHGQELSAFHSVPPTLI